ncbi:hypothetical protein [Thalassobacillus devorans]|uniref:hypothetical protein n=1 Tax=Thalassobacillus devorans TaxID=279813 RepID=UPI000490A7B2|nr:hypothetical protein [Thalassobacillus devorans]
MVDMNLSGLLVWMIFPYVSVAVFMMGMIWRYEEGAKKKQVPMMYHVTMISLFIINGILLIGLFYSDGIHWLGWYRDFLMFQPDVNAIMPSSGMQQIQVPMFFFGLVMLPFSIYMPSLSSPFKHVKQVRRLVKNAI